MMNVSLDFIMALVADKLLMGLLTSLPVSLLKLILAESRSFDINKELLVVIL